MLPRVRSSTTTTATLRLARHQQTLTMSPPVPAPAPSAPFQKIDSHHQYLTTGIPSPAALAASPMAQFSRWFEDAEAFPIVEPEAFALSTVSGRGVPSTRVLLLKRVDERGFVFFTNYDSRKGRELFPPLPAGEVEPVSQPGQPGRQGTYASMAFYWRAQHRSVRVVGRAEKVSQAETQEYFDGRPVGSRVGAWASPQSKVLEGREELEESVKAVEERFGVREGGGDASAVPIGPGAGTAATVGGGKDEPVIPVPPFWGGVRIVPFEVEFWMGRESRLHDRVRYTREEGSDGEWEKVRLAP